MIESVLGKSVAANLSTGGTVDGDLTVTGSLGVGGDASINLTSVVSNSTIIDATGTEAFLVRANSDGGDVFTVDTTNSKIIVGDISLSGSTISDNSALTISSGDDIIIDATSDINLDADGGDIRFKDNGTNFVTFSSSTGSTFSGDILVNNSTPALTLQDSDGSNQTLEILHSGANAFFTSRNGSSNGAFFFRSYNGSSFSTALELDSSQNATFAGDIFISNSTPLLRLDDSDVSTNVSLDGSGGIVKLASHTGQTIRFLIGSTEVSRFNSSGYLGINDTNAEAHLTVSPSTVGTTSLGGRSINYGVNINTASGRSGVTVKPANNYAIGDDNAGFQWLYPFDDGGNGDFKAFRVSEGATLVDKFYATRDGQGYFASNVGIGTTNPMGNSDGIVGLEISSGASTGLTLKSTSSSQIYSLWADSSGNLKVQDNTNNETRLTIDSSGNTGIGVSPTGKLDINISSNARGYFASNIGEVGSGNFALQVVDSGGSTLKPLGFRADDIRFATGSAERMRLTDTGLGIGTDNPVAKLVVSDGGNAGIELQPEIATDTNRITNYDRTASAYMNFRLDALTQQFLISGSEKMRLDSSGNFGIGSTAKTHLDVQSYQADGITIGADNDANRTRTNSTSKSGGITGVHYTNAEESIRLLGYSSSSSANILLLGGGNGDWNSATDINFYVGANTTTTAGDLRFKLDTNSRISLSNNDSGSGGADSTSGTTLFGYIAGGNVTSSSKNNSFIGHASGNRNTSGDENTGVGRYAGLGNFTGNNNTFVGSNSGLSDNSDSHSNNTGVGYSSLKSITTGSENTVVGSLAADALKTGEKNCVVGVNALRSAAFGETGNVAIGHHSMFSLNEGSIGTADNNIAIGQQALLGGAFAGNPITVSDNIAIGAFALDNTSDNAQTGTIAIGRDALGALTSGASNTAVGYKALRSETAGALNTAIGYEALETQNGVSGVVANTALGYYAGTALTTGIKNTMLGAYAGYSSLLPDNCTLVGYNAGGSGVMTADADGTTAIGMNSLSNLTTGAQNVGVGYSALGNCTTGKRNTAVGYEVMHSAMDVGDNNTAVGYSSLYSLNPDTDDHGENTGVGSFSGYYITTGTGNTCIGYAAGGTGSTNIVTGDNNTILGHNSRVSATDAVNQTVIGQGVAGQGNNSVTLGNSSVTSIFAPTKTAIQSYGTVAITDGSTITLAGSNLGAAILCIYEASGGIGGVFALSYQFAAVQLAGSSDTSTSDSAGDVCVINGTNNHTVTIKNNTGAQKNFRIMIYSAAFN